jgi:outer membrane protein TolC
MFFVFSSMVWAEEQEGFEEASQVEILDLASVQRLALKGNPSLGAAQARIEQAKARIDQLIAAQRPSLDAVASLGGQANTDKFVESSSFGLQASWLLFDGHARRLQQEQAQYGEQSSREAKRNSQRLLLAAVADAFFNLQLARNSIEISQSDQDFYAKQLSDAQHRFEAGTGAWGDILNIRVQVNAGKNAVIAGERDYEAALYGLAALLAVPETLLAAQDLAPLEEIPEHSEVQEDLDTLIQEALVKRPDMKRLSWQLKAADAGIRQSEALDSPRLQLKGQMGSSSQARLIPEKDDLGLGLSLNLSWNLYSGGAHQAARAEAWQAKRETQYGAADLANGIKHEVQQAYTLLRAAKKQVHLQQDSVALVTENRKLAQDEYESGSTSLVRLNEAQRDLTSTYGRLAQALVGFHQARHRLLAAMGKNIQAFENLLDADQPLEIR